MACKKCKNPITIEAHLIPRCFAIQVQTGKSHAAGVHPNNVKFNVSQSGIWDNKILCKECDGHLGDHENYALKISKLIRADGSQEISEKMVIENVDKKRMMRFCAGILYKYSLTTVENGKIDLGKYQEICQEIAFTDNEIPKCFDVFAIRLIRYSNDNEVFAYRSPSPDRKEGINYYRLFIGGILFFIKVDQKLIQVKQFKDVSLQNTDHFTYMVLPATMFEEYQQPKSMIEKNARLSKYLDKVNS